jgi:hypothetical protein
MFSVSWQSQSAKETVKLSRMDQRIKEKGLVKTHRRQCRGIRASYITTADVLCQLYEGDGVQAGPGSVNVCRLDCEAQICCDKVGVRGQHDQGVSA